MVDKRNLTLTPPKPYLRPIINVLVHPKSGWDNIAREDIPIGALYLWYILPWAGLLPLSMLIAWGTMKFPNDVAGQQMLFAPNKPQLVIIAVFGYLLNVLIVPLTAFVANAKAVAFLGEKNFAQAMKATTFSLVPSWMTPVTVLVPSLSFLQLVSLLYSAYLFFYGLPILMKIPPEKRMSYSLTVGVLTAAALLAALLVLGPLVVLALNSLNP